MYFVYVLYCFHLHALVVPRGCRFLTDREFSFQVAAADKLIITIHVTIKTSLIFLKRIFYDNRSPQRFMYSIKNKSWKTKRHFPLKSKTPNYHPPPFTNPTSLP